MKLFLVINLGLRSIRVILFNQHAEVLEKNWYPVQTTIRSGIVEQNPDEWWLLCKRLLRELFLKNLDYRKKLVSITVTSSAACLVVLNNKGKVLLPALMVSDKRAEQQAKKLRMRKSLRTIFRNPNNIASASFMMPKILWIKENNKIVFKQASFFLSSNDFLIHQLTGKTYTDPLNAEKFYYEQKSQKYPQLLLRQLGISSEQLPQVNKVGTEVGPLTQKLQEELGLSQDVRVVLSSYDAICSFIGSGATREGEANNVGGTVTSVRVLTKRNVKSSKGILLQTCNDFKMIGGSNNIDGGLLEWSKDMFYGDTYPDKYVYTIMAEEAEQSPLGANGLLFLPYLIGERVPFLDADARGIFFGLERFHTRRDVMRSIYEASGFMTHDIIEHIERRGVVVKSIRMSGGLALSPVACRIRADITGKPLYVTRDLETTSIGALFIQLVTAGIYKNLHQTARLVTYSQVYKPNVKNHRTYLELFRMFKKIYENNKKLMTERNEVIKRLKFGTEHILENL